MSEMSTVPEANEGGSAAQLPHRYHFGPFLIRSEIEIPELAHTAREFAVNDLPVTILCGGVPGDIPNAASFGRFCRVSTSEYLLEIPNVARFHVANADTVRVQLAERALGADVSTFLLGSIFGALCHQNGLLPLHASAVEQGGSVTAFLGNSGAGKSTLAACLHARGHRIVSDDICLLAPHNHEMRVIPVAGWLKLWRASLSHLGRTPDEADRVYSADDKYRVYLNTDVAERPLLTTLVFLARAAVAKPTLEPLPTVEAIAQMMLQTYLAYIPALTGTQPRNFRQCAQVLSRAQAFRLTAPWGFDRMDAVLDLLEKVVLTPADAPQ
jgi:hypothetical protein